MQKIQKNKITQTFEHLYEISKNGLEEKCFQDERKRKDKSFSKELTLRSNLVRAREELVKVSRGPPWVLPPRVLTGVEGAQVE